MQHVRQVYGRAADRIWTQITVSVCRILSASAVSPFCDSLPVGGGLNLLLPARGGAGDVAGDGDADSASSESSSESLSSPSLKERSLTPSSRGVRPVSSRGVCLQAVEGRLANRKLHTVSVSNAT